MKTFLLSFLWVFTTLCFGYLCLKAGASMRLPQPVCIEPKKDLGHDGADFRLFLSALNPKVCFKHGIAERNPELIGLKKKRGLYDVWWR